MGGEFSRPGQSGLILIFYCEKFDLIVSRGLPPILGDARSIRASVEDTGDRFKTGHCYPTGIGSYIFTDEEVKVSPNGSQVPEVIDIEWLIAKVPKAVRYACRFYGYQASQDEVEDFSQFVFLKMLKNNGRILRSFEGRSSIDTWLYAVVRRELKPYLLGRQWEEENMSDVDDLSPETLRYNPNQEERLIDEDKRKTLHALISRLPDRKRQLLELLLEEMKPEEIAKEMGIKIDSVYRLKNTIIKEFQRLIEGGG